MNEQQEVPPQHYRHLQVEAPIVAGYAKLKYVGQFYKYKATPQFLDQELMMTLFNNTLARGEVVKAFYRESMSKHAQGSHAKTLAAAIDSKVAEINVAAYDQGRATLSRRD